MSRVELKQSMEETLKVVEESVVDYLLAKESQYYFDSVMSEVEALLANLTNKSNGIQGKSQFKDFLDFFFNYLIAICLKYSKDVVNKQDIEMEVVSLMTDTVNKVLRYVDDEATAEPITLVAELETTEVDDNTPSTSATDIKPTEVTNTVVEPIQSAYPTTEEPSINLTQLPQPKEETVMNTIETTQPQLDVRRFIEDEVKSTLSSILNRPETTTVKRTIVTNPHLSARLLAQQSASGVACTTEELLNTWLEDVIEVAKTNNLYLPRLLEMLETLYYQLERPTEQLLRVQSNRIVELENIIRTLQNANPTGQHGFSGKPMAGNTYQGA